METQIQDADTQAFSYQHADGEVFMADNIEAARGMCPVLGKMSLEDAGLLLELEAMGREQMAAEPDTRQKPNAEEKQPGQPIKSTEKAEEDLVQHNNQSKITPEEILITAQAARELESAIQPEAVVAAADYHQREDVGVQTLTPDIHNFLVQQAEAARLLEPATKVDSQEQIETSVAAEVQPVESIDESTPTPLSTKQVVEVAIKPADNTQHIEELVKAGVVLKKVIEAIAPVRPGPNSSVDEAIFVYEGEIVLEKGAAGVEQKTTPINLNATLHENLEEQPEEHLGLEPDPPYLAMATEPAETAHMTDYETLELDDPTRLMAELEDSATNAGEDNEPSLLESLVLVAADTIGSESTPIELQPIIPMPELESLTELPAPPEAIETAITLLAEALELAEPESEPDPDPNPNPDEPQEAYQILEAIIKLPDSLEAIAGEAEEAIGQKLEELFVELFDQTGVEHTPELIRSFVKLTQAHYLSELIQAVKQDEPQGSPNETGTREFLQKLRHGLASLKRAAAHFYEIGQSALRLYGLDRTVPQLAQGVYT